MRVVVLRVAAVAALSLGLTASRWLPSLMGFAGANSDQIQGLSGIADLLWYAMSALLLFFAWLGRRRPETDAGAGTTSVARGKRSVSVGGDVSGAVVTGDNPQVEVTRGDRLSVPADEGSFRRYLEAREAAPAGPPPEPQEFVGRQGELSELRTRLLGRGPAVEGCATVVTGTPGIGKTALVTVATVDDAIQGAFPGGVYWVFLGPSADVVEELGRLARRLGSVLDGRPRDLAEARARVASLIPEDRALVVVVDDAFSTSDTAAFRVAESRATLLFTTRDREVARQLSPGQPGPLELEALPEDDALELLGRLTPDTVEAHRSGAQELVRDLGGMPLAIRIAGGLLATEERMGWGVEGLLYELREGRKVLRSEAPADRLPVPEGASPTVAALLQTSLERLPAQAVDRFRVLGASPAKPTSFDVAAAASVWTVDEEVAKGTIRELEGRGLLEPAGSGRFYLHPILASYARLRLETDSVGTRLHEAKLGHARHYRQVLLDAEQLHRQGGRATRQAVEALEQEMAHVTAGQRWAQERSRDGSDAAELCVRYAVCAPDVIGKVLKPSERRRWLEAAVAVAHAIDDETLRRRAESHLATAYTGTAQNDRATTILQRHLQRARSENNREDEIVALGNLAVAHHHRHEEDEAEDCYRRIVAIASEVGNEMRETHALQDLALSLGRRGEHRAATALLRDVLVRARAKQDEVLEAGVLHRLADNQDNRGHPRRAEVLARASLRIHEERRDAKGQAYALNSLGSALAVLAEADEARRCFRRALDLADEWELSDLKAVATSNLGDVALNLEGDPDKALSLYADSIRLARLAGLKEIEAKCQWNTAGILRLRPGEARAALEHAQEASRLLGEIGDARREQVWSLIREIAQAQ